MNIKVKDCFTGAKKDEERGKKHKGLIIIEKDNKTAEDFVQKAKKNLELCELYKENKLDYKIPEEWFYTMYYCALAILMKFGVQSRSQRCTALFLRYLKDNKLIDYDIEFIDRITVFSDKKTKSDVDEREESRYSASIESEEIKYKYNSMMDICKKCISNCEEIVFSNKEFKIPGELTD